MIDFPDEERIRKALKGEDPQALFDLFVELYHKRSRGLLYSLPALRNRPHDVDDIHQELWERVWKSLPNFSLEGSETEEVAFGSASRRSWGWVLVIARRLSVDWQRKHALQRDKGQVPWDENLIARTIPDESPSVSDSVEERELCKLILSSLDRYREAHPDVPENLIQDKLSHTSSSDVQRQKRFRAWARFSHWFYEEQIRDWITRLHRGDDTLPEMSDTLREKPIWRESISIQLLTMRQEERDLVWPHLERLLGNFADTIKELVLNRDTTKLLRNGYFPPHLRSQLAQVKLIEGKSNTLLGKTRAQFRLTLRSFGRELGVSHTLISQVESGRMVMSKELERSLEVFLHHRGASLGGFSSPSSQQSWDLRGLLPSRS